MGLQDNDNILFDASPLMEDHRAESTLPKISTLEWSIIAHETIAQGLEKKLQKPFHNYNWKLKGKCWKAILFSQTKSNMSNTQFLLVFFQQKNQANTIDLDGVSTRLRETLKNKLTSAVSVRWLNLFT